MTRMDQQDEESQPLNRTANTLYDTAAKRIGEMAERNGLTERETRATVYAIVEGTISGRSASGGADGTTEESMQTLRTLRARGLIDHASDQEPSAETPCYLTARGEREGRILLHPSLEAAGDAAVDIPTDMIDMVAVAIEAAIARDTTGREPQA